MNDYFGKNIPQLKKILWQHFSLFIRRRDFARGCISCRKLIRWGGTWQAGHYYPKSVVYASIAYDEMNVHGQCAFCNKFLEGNRQGYREGIIRRYGQEALDALDIRRSLKSHWTRFEYQSLILHYAEKNKINVRPD